MKTLLIAICFALAAPTFASTLEKTANHTEIGDNPIPQYPPKPKP